MKTTLSLLSVILLCGCAGRIEWKRGIALDPVTPPANSVVRAEVSSIGLSVGQNQASQTPEVVIGYKRATYTRVPTSTNGINVVPVRATIGVDGGLKVGITESLETGDAAK